MKKLILLGLLCVFAAFAGCGSGEPEIYGSWECMHTDTAICDWICRLNFSADGSFTGRGGESGNFAIEDGMITFTLANGTTEEFVQGFNQGRLTLRMPDVPGVSGQLILRRPANG